MSDKRREMPDAEIERVLKEYRRQKQTEADVQDIPEAETKKQHIIFLKISAFFKSLSKKFWSSLDKLDRELMYPNKWWSRSFDKIYNFRLLILDKSAAFAEKKRICPYLLDFAYSIIRSFIICLLLSIPIYIIIGLYWGEFKTALLFVVCMDLIVPSLMLLLAFLNLVVPLYLLDILTLKRTVTRNVELRIIGIQITVGKFMETDISYLPRFFNTAIPCYFFYIPLKDNHVPKSSKPKEPPQFYRCKGSYQGKEWRTFRFIMTKRKSKQIDKLFKLDPSAEFEITYLFFSHILQKIRPIEGYEYAKSVPEILESINKMYP